MSTTTVRAGRPETDGGASAGDTAASPNKASPSVIGRSSSAVGGPGGSGSRPRIGAGGKSAGAAFPTRPSGGVELPDPIAS